MTASETVGAIVGITTAVAGLIVPIINAFRQRDLKKKVAAHKIRQQLEELRRKAEAAEEDNVQLLKRIENIERNYTELIRDMLKILK